MRAPPVPKPRTEKASTVPPFEPSFMIRDGRLLTMQMRFQNFKKP